MKFSDNQYYIEKYIKCDNCGCEGREWNVVMFDGMEITKRPIESGVE